jgi:ribonucleotide reductase beta subunit family protein with ferritin-like domain
MGRFLLFSKSNAACSFCEKCKDLFEKHRLEYDETSFENLAGLKTHVQEFIDPENVTSFPLIVTPDKNVVYGYQQLRDLLEERVLCSPEKLSVFPVQYPKLFGFYKKHVASFWVADEIEVDSPEEFESLDAPEREFLTNILAFFAQSDGIVNANLMRYFINEVKLQESLMFYSIQSFMESEHGLTYSLMLENLIRDEGEKKRCFDAISEIPAVKKKANWAMKYMSPTRRFCERLVAFAAVEGILFSGSFAAIFWIKQQYPDKMKGLYQANSFISRDENLHYDHAVELFRTLDHKPDEKTVHAIIREAVDHEIEFITESISCKMIGMSVESMTLYIKFVADTMARDLGFSALYGVGECPFNFMQTLGMNSKTNFFETRPTEYQKSTGNLVMLGDDDDDDDDF